jgi:tRNA (cmo5U34)-methyltransferase
MAFDRCASVDDQLAWLRAAGFDADCLFKDHRFAVLAAVRPG